MSTLSDELKQMDFMAGASGRSVQALEALWGAPLVSWGEAYLTAKERGRLPAHDQANGKTVAFLEGLLAGLRMNAGALDEWTKANATYKHLWRSAGQLVKAQELGDQESFDSALAGIRQIIEAAQGTDGSD